MGGQFGGMHNSFAEYSITYDGVINENYFPIKARENELLNNLEISHCKVRNPITNEEELYLGLIVKSKYDGTPGIREPLDICITLDISGSMTSFIGANQDDDLTRNDLSVQSIVKLVQQLKDEDGIAINTFDTESHNIVPFTLKKNLTQKNIDDIKAIKPSGDENIYNALKGAMEQLEHSEKKNKRIIIITDLWAHDSQLSNFKELFKKCVHENKIEITIIGISQDANSHLAEVVAYEKGCNYYNVLYPNDLEKYLVKQFNYICFPYSYNVKVKYNSTNLKVVQCLGVGDKKIKEGNNVDICEMGSAVPSELKLINGENYMEGGLILLKLEKQNNENINFSCELILEYEDRNFVKNEQRYKYEVNDESTADNYFSSKAIEKGIALHYYTSMCKNLLNYKNAFNQNKFENLRSPDSAHQKKWDEDKEKYGKYHDIKIINKVMEFLKEHYLIVDGIPNHYERYEKKMYDASELNTPKRYQGE